MRTPEQVIEDFGAYVAPLAVGEMCCLPLDPHRRLLGKPRVVSRGVVADTDAGPRAFFRSALAAGVTSGIAAHHYPNGNPTPDASSYLGREPIGRAV